MVRQIRGMVLPICVRLPGKPAAYFMEEAKTGKSLGSIGLELIEEALRARGIETE